MFSRRYIFLLPLLTLAAARLACAADPPTTTAGNVSIQLPSGWTLGTGDSRTILAARAPKPDKDASGNTYQASLSISQNAGTTKFDAAAGAAQQAMLAQKLTSYVALETPKAVTIAGVEGITFGGTFKQNGTDLRARQYMFNVNNQIYTITFTCLSSTWAAYLPAVESSVASFALKK